MRLNALTVAAVLFLMGSVPAAAEVPVLGNETVIEGSVSGYTLVQIPREWNSEDTTVTLAGGGLLRGAAMTTDDGLGSLLEWFRTGPEGAAGERRGGTFAGGQDPQAPGLYRLYLYTDGEPARAVVRVEGLTGRIELTPDHPIPVEAQPIRELGREGREVWFGARVAMPPRGVVIYYETWKFAPRQQAEYSLCHFMPGMDASDDAFRRPCRGQTYFSPWPEPLWPAPGEGATSGSFGDWARGTYGFGGWARVRTGEPGTIGGKVWAINWLLPDRDAPRAEPEAPAAPAPAPPPPPIPHISKSARVADNARTAMVAIACRFDHGCAGHIGWPHRRPVPYTIEANSRKVVRLGLTPALRRAVRTRGRTGAKLIVHTADGGNATKRVRLIARSR